MSLILADTSGLYSLLNRRDSAHEQVNQFYRSLPRHTEIVVIEYVLVETMTLLRARGFSALAVQFRQSLLQSQIFNLQYSSSQLEQDTFEIFQQFAD